MKQIVEGAWLIPLGPVNSVLLQGDDGELVLIDAGFPGHEDTILAAIDQLGRRPEHLGHLVFTHAHPDHIGSGAAVVARTGARTWMHSADVPISEGGGPFRPMRSAPGPVQKLLFRVFWRPNDPIEPVPIDEQLQDGDSLPLVGGLEVVHTPGHSAGHVSLLWRRDRLLIVGDVGSNFISPDDPLGFEDRDEGRRSQRRLAGLHFDAAAFGHGRAIAHGASERIRRRWQSAGA